MGAHLSLRKKDMDSLIIFCILYFLAMLIQADRFSRILNDRELTDQFYDKSFLAFLAAFLWPIAALRILFKIVGRLLLAIAK